MPASHRPRAIRKFNDLIRYLEDELNWLLAQYGFEDFKFKYVPADVRLREEDPSLP
jgi:hypothetical protein